MPDSNIKLKRSIKLWPKLISPLVTVTMLFFVSYIFWPYLSGTGAHDFYSEDQVGIDLLAGEFPGYQNSQRSNGRHESLNSSQISRKLTPLRNYIDPFEQYKTLEYVEHEVKPGESLWAIAKKYGREIYSVASANYSRLARLGHLPSGIKLQIPNRDGILTQLDAGQTLWDLMKTYDVDYKKILVFNGIESTNQLRRGMDLFVPGAQPVNRFRYQFDQGGGGQTYAWPVPPGRRRITSGFGNRVHPILGREIFHTGIDIAGAHGAKAYVARAGRVNYVGYIRGYGNVITVRHSRSVETFYAHLSGALVSRGEYVEKGQPVGLIGSTGHATGPHLHFEIRVHGEPVNPNKHLP